MQTPDTNHLDCKILIIDDEERLLRVLRMGLKPMGYHVRTANNGEEGLEEVLSQSFDIVLTDIKMPKMMGTEFVFELERLSMDIPVIVMTAYADVESATKTLKHGAVDYIQKPFTVEELDSIIQKVLSKRVPREEIAHESLRDGVEQAEKELIERALLKSKNNKVKAAKILKISERALWYKIKKYDLTA